MNRFASLVLAGALALPSASSAQGLALAAHAGTLGVGGALILEVTPKVNARGTIGFIPTEPTFTVDNVDFTVDFPTLTKATLDFALTNFFYLSGGGLFISNGGAIDVSGAFTGTQDFGGTTYSSAEVGTLTGSFELTGSMPYLGIGFGDPTGREVGLGLELGVGLGGTPTVDLGATGPVASDPTFISNLDLREREIQNDIPEVLRYYPVAILYVSFAVGR